VIKSSRQRRNGCEREKHISKKRKIEIKRDRIMIKDAKMLERFGNWNE